jgi:hypothetical protein
MEIDKSAIRNLQKDHGVSVNFERIAVTQADIDIYNLPTRPAKTTDPRASNFKGESVEIDAMDLSVLREKVRQCIIEHINPEEWAAQKRIEEQEREVLNEVVNALGGRV